MSTWTVYPVQHRNPAEDQEHAAHNNPFRHGPSLLLLEARQTAREISQTRPNASSSTTTPTAQEITS